MTLDFKLPSVSRKMTPQVSRLALALGETVECPAYVLYAGGKPRLSVSVPGNGRSPVKV